MEEHEKFMRKALTLARKGVGRVSPNPMVGAVIVNDGEIVGQGFHQEYGQAHAEINALEKAGLKAEGGTMYVNLEPCSHDGKTPPCVDAIIKAGIKSCYIGIIDPNPLVAGQGLKALREAGLEVEVGVLEKECRDLNEVFFKYITTGIPFVLMKAASTLDGKIATAGGESRWVTSEKSREMVHQLRSELDVVMVGINTVIKDDPLLTCRLPGSYRQPLRVILDSKLRLPLSSQLVNTAKEVGVMIATGKDADPAKMKKLSNAGVEVVEFDLIKDRLPLIKVLSYLGERQLIGIMIEGGGEVFASALGEKIVDKAYFFLAPKILGGRDSTSMISGENPKHMADALDLTNVSIKRIDEDILVSGYPDYHDNV